MELEHTGAAECAELANASSYHKLEQLGGHNHMKSLGGPTGHLVVGAVPCCVPLFQWSSGQCS